MHLNVEIKAVCSDPHEVRSLLHEKNAIYKGCDNQIDTYFNVPDGRLKLREGNIENALVFYKRSNQEGPKESKVILYSIPKETRQKGTTLKETTLKETTLKEILAESLGILAVVDKKRHIYFIDNVKFHVDIVKDLGSFCEIEAIDMKGDIGREKLLGQCEFYMSHLKIKKEDLISCSYSDLILEKIKRKI